MSDAMSRFDPDSARDFNYQQLVVGDYVKYIHPHDFGVDAIAEIDNIYTVATSCSTYWYVSVKHVNRYVVSSTGMSWEQTTTRDFSAHEVEKVTKYDYDEYTVMRKLTT